MDPKDDTVTLTRERLDELLAMARESGQLDERLANVTHAYEMKRADYGNVRFARQKAKHASLALANALSKHARKKS